MARDLNSTQKKIVNRYYEHRDTIMLDKLGQLVSDLYLAESPAKAEKLWKSAATALGNLAANNAQVRKVLEDRSVEGLAQLVNEMTVSDKAKPASATSASSSASPSVSPSVSPSPASTAAPASPAAGAASASPAPAAEPSADQLKAAMKAFRKRLKLTKLDEESKLGRSPLTGGQQSGVVAIQPPRDYPIAVWEALADQEKLKRAGRGFYQLGPKA